MSVEGRRGKEVKIAQWENELWSYLSKGDGVHCPIRHNCQVRRRGGTCFEDSYPLHQHFKMLMSIKMSKPENNFDIMASDANYFFEFEDADYFFENGLTQ